MTEFEIPLPRIVGNPHQVPRLLEQLGAPTDLSEHVVNVRARQLSTWTAPFIGALFYELAQRGAAEIHVTGETPALRRFVQSISNTASFKPYPRATHQEAAAATALAHIVVDLATKAVPAVAGEAIRHLQREGLSDTEISKLAGALYNRGALRRVATNRALEPGELRALAERATELADIMERLDATPE